MAVTLFTGGQDRHYAFGLAMALTSQDIVLEVIGSIAEDGPEMHRTAGLQFYPLYVSSGECNGFIARAGKILLSYWRLLRYAIRAKTDVFHILWNYKVQSFDRTLLMVIYKLAGKKITLTAHNVNAGRRDATDSLLNRLTLRIQYRLCDHIFVHTPRMKQELSDAFAVSGASITIVPYGINNAVPCSDLTVEEARLRLAIAPGEKVVLFFGAIKPYKGLDYLIPAFQQLGSTRKDCRLVIAGERKKGYEGYWDGVNQAIEGHGTRDQILRKIGYIPDDEIETYFKAADVLVLPYTEIFQSGILFLAYTFGLPVVAADVGSFRADIVEGKTGYVCRPRDSADLARTLDSYFDSTLFNELSIRRAEIRDFFAATHSWDAVARMTGQVYSSLMAKEKSSDE